MHPAHPKYDNQPTLYELGYKNCVEMFLLYTRKKKYRKLMESPLVWSSGDHHTTKNIQQTDQDWMQF